MSDTPKSKTEKIMPGTIKSHIPRLIREKFPELEEKELAKELMFGCRLTRNTALRFVDPSYEPKTIYFDNLTNICNFFGVGVGEVLEYIPD